MDLLSIKPRTLDIELRHPATAAPLGVTVTCASSFSDEVMSEMHRIRDDAVRANFFEMTSAEKAREGMKMIAAQIVGWQWRDGASLGDDTSPALTRDNKMRLLSNPYFHAQISAGISRDADFFDGPESV